MSKTVGVALVLLVLATAALMWWAMRDDIHPSPAAPEARLGSNLTARSGQMPVSPTPTAAVPAVPLGRVDCAHPIGDAARSEAGVVTAAQLCKEFVALGGKPGPIEAPEAKAMARLVLDRLIDEPLVAAALAAERTAVTDADVDVELARLPGNSVDPARPGLQDSLRRTGVDVALVRKELLRRLLWQRLIAARGDGEPSAGDIDRELAAHPERYRASSVLKVQAWLVRVAPKAVPAVDAAARSVAQAFALHVASNPPETMPPQPQRLEAVPEFELGGGGTEPALVAAVAALQPGQWTSPVRTRVGWLVARLVERAPQQASQLPQVRTQVATRLREMRRLEAQTAITAALRQQARVEILIDL